MHTTTRVLDGFDEPAISPANWERLLRSGDTDAVYLTWQWQRAFWETRGKGELLLIAAERGGEVVALAPLHTYHGGMIYFIGHEGADYLDFIGDVSDPAVLDAILETAIGRVPGFLGLRLKGVPDQSRTGARLKDAADRLGLSCYHGGAGKVLVLDLAKWAAEKKKPLRHEAFFRGLSVSHFSDGRAILPHLEEFFQQSIARFADTASESTFAQPARRLFVERVTSLAADAGWLRFTRLVWEGRAFAFHFGYCYRGTYYGHKSSFAMDLARKSPGQLLDRQVLLAAVDEGAKLYDLGGTADAWKLAFNPTFNRTSTWELYPKEGASRARPTR